MEKKFLSTKEIEKLSNSEKITYFEQLRNFCKNLPYEMKDSYAMRKFSSFVSTTIRNYDFDIIGIENIPSDGKGLFVVNHSNSHDFYTMQETFNNIGLQHTFFASNEGISSAIVYIFNKCGGVTFNRTDKNETNEAFFKFVSNIINGMPGVIYSESTWNLHPFKPMHLIKAGAVNISAIARVPIIPTIYEYVEVPYLCKKESDIYSRVIVKFGKPIYISMCDSILDQTEIVQKAMENSRISLWKELGTMRSSVDDINVDVYLNHTSLKKFVNSVDYDSVKERSFLLIKDQLSSENEYHLDEFGNFVPGIITKEESKQYLLKKRVKV